MNKLGTIVHSLCKSLYEVREHNKKIDEREKRMGRKVTRLRTAAGFVFPMILSLGLTVTGLYFLLRGDKEPNAVVEHIKVGNYKTAQTLLDNLDQSPAEKLETIVRGTWKRELKPEDVEKFFLTNHHSISGNARFRIFKGSEEEFSTSLEKITASNGTEYYVIGDSSGNLFFFNGDHDFRTGVSSRINGKLVPCGKNNEQGVLATTLGGLIYEISIETSRTDDGSVKQVPVVKARYDAHEEISELRAADINDDWKAEYFFTTKSGRIIGITEKGEEIFRERILPEDEELDTLIPPTIARTSAQGPLEIIQYRNGGVVIYDVRGEILRYVSVPGESLANEILTGDIDGDGQFEIIVMTDKKPYLLKLTGKGEEGRPTEGTWIPQELDFDVNKYPDYRWVLADFNNDNAVDVVYGECGMLKMAYGSLNGSFSLPNTAEKDANYFTSKPLVADVTGDRGKEIIVGTDEGNLFIIDPSTRSTSPTDHRNIKLELKIGHGIKFKGESIRYDTLNARRYLTFAAGNTAYMLGDAWLKEL